MRQHTYNPSLLQNLNWWYRDYKKEFWANYQYEDYCNEFHIINENEHYLYNYDYDDFIAYKFFNNKINLNYHDYQNFLYESLSYSYDPLKLYNQLSKIKNIRDITFGSDDLGEFPDQLCVTTYNKSSDTEIKKVCKFFGYYIAKEEDLFNYNVRYVIETRFGLTEFTDTIYTEFDGILYHVTSQKALHKILKNGLCPKAHNKKVIYPERIYCSSGFNSDKDAINELSILGNELYPNKDFVILKIDIKKNNFKCKFFMDPAYSKYGCFTYENINPCCLSVIS